MYEGKGELDSKLQKNARGKGVGGERGGRRGRMWDQAKVRCFLVKLQQRLPFGGLEWLGMGVRGCKRGQVRHKQHAAFENGQHEETGDH